MKPNIIPFNTTLHILLAILSTLILLITANNYPNYTPAALADEPKPLYDSPEAKLPPSDAGYTVYDINDQSELETVLGKTDLNKWLNLSDNVTVPDGQEFEFTQNQAEKLVINLGMVNFQTDSDFHFNTTGGVGSSAEIAIIGSTMVANVGFKLEGKIELTYFGVYSSGHADILAPIAGDDITFNLTGKNSRWDAKSVNPKFINGLPTTPNTYERGTIVIGEAGTAAVKITSGNDVNSGEVIVGAKENSEGTLNLSGIYEIEDIYNEGETIKKSTTWNNTGTIYIGYEGKGTATIEKGAILNTGSIGIGITKDKGNGTLNVTGLASNGGDNFLDQTKNPNYIIQLGTPLNSKDKDYIGEAQYLNPDATIVNIYGRDDEDKNNFLNPGGTVTTLKSDGTGVMKITDGAIIVFDETTIESGEPTNLTPKITLGKGASTVENSIIIGARDATWGDDADDNFDDVGLIDGTATDGDFIANSLTFKNNAVLQGNLKIYMKENIFGDKSYLSPGFGSYQFYMPSNEALEHEKFGRVDFKNETFKHQTGATTIIDFDVHGDRNYRKDPNKQTAYPLGGDDQDYADDATYRGRDLIIIYGKAELAGDIYFRPQTGYYSDNILVDFMRVTGDIAGQYKLHLYPYRWFKEPKFQTAHVDGFNYNQLSAARNTTPFTDVARNYNQHGVGGALNNIFNAQSNYKWLPILNWFWLMNDDELREAERLLSGEIKASSFYLPLRSPWRFGFDRVNWSDKGHKIYFGTQNYGSPETQRHTLWATAYYDYQSIDDDHNTSSMSTQRVSLMTGYDRVLPRSFNIGIFSDSAIGCLFSYSQPKLDQKGNRVIADDFLLGFHSATRLYSHYELKSWIGIGTQKYRLHRTIPIPDQIPDLRTSYKGNSATGSIQLTRPVKWYGLSFRPHIAADLSYVKQYHALESYTGEIMKQTALRYHSSDWTQFLARTGLRLDYSRNCCNFTATLGYSYLLLGTQAPKTTHQFAYAGGGKFNILGNNLNRSFVNVDLGTQLHLNKKKTRSLYLQYNGNYSKYMNAHTASIGYQFLF